MAEVMIRPMRPDDVAAAERLSAESFRALGVRRLPRTAPEPGLRAAAHAATWSARTTHLLGTDPGGCWVADDADGAMAGFATSLVRDKTWILATYAVQPHLQGRGIGRQLLEAAGHHGRGCLRAMLSASDDPRALRRYRLAGFSLHPQMHLSGTVDRTAIPVVTKVREGGATDTDLMDSVDRRVRGAAHGPDHPLMQRSWRVLVADSMTGSGYAYLDERGGVALLGASNRRTATELLWTAIADGPAEQDLRHVTAANEWAIDVGMAARLTLDHQGYLALRGMAPPTPYLHQGALL